MLWALITKTGRAGGRHEHIPRNHVKDRDWVHVGYLDCSPTLETGSSATPLLLSPIFLEGLTTCLQSRRRVTPSISPKRRKNGDLTEMRSWASAARTGGSGQTTHKQHSCVYRQKGRADRRGCESCWALTRTLQGSVSSGGRGLEELH